MSKQLTLLNETWETNKNMLVLDMLLQADQWLASEPDRHRPHSLWEYYRGDGLWLPFGQRNPNYDEYIAKYGNEDDEEQQLVNLWLYVLAKANDGGKYNALILDLAETQAFGY